MSEVVGSVSIELSVDRTEYDKTIARLKREQPDVLMIKTSLDTSHISKQLNAFKVVSDLRIGATVDTRNIDRQMTDLLKTRSLKVDVMADLSDIERKMKTLSVGDIKVKAKLDSTDLAKSLRQFETVSDLRVKVSIDDSALKSVRSIPELKLKAVVDDSALTKLNAHLDLKEQHFKLVQAVFSGSPLTPKVDDSGLGKLNDAIDLTARKFAGFKGAIETTLTAKINSKEIDGLTASLRLASATYKTSSSAIQAPIVLTTDSSSIAVAHLKLSQFQSDLTSLNSASATEISLKVNHLVDSSNLEKTLSRAADRFEKSGDSVGSSISKNVSKSDVKINAGPFQSVFRGIFESVGQKVSSGFSGNFNTMLAGLGSKAENYVTSKAGKATVMLSQNLGYKNTREMRSEIRGVMGVADRFIDPSKSRRDMKQLEVATGKALADFLVDGKSVQESMSHFFTGTGDGIGQIKSVAQRTAGGLLRQMSPVLRINKDVQLARAAKQADSMASEMEISDRTVAQMKQYNGIAFAIGGQHNMEGRGGEEVVKPMLQRVMPGAYVEGMSNKYRDSSKQAATGINNALGTISPGTTIEGLLKRSKLDKIISPNIVKMVDTAVFSGATPEVIEAAARAKVLRNKGVDAPIAAVGYSAGGADAADFVNITRRIGVDARGVGIGSPLTGLANRQDKNFTSVMGTNDHIYRGLFGSKDLQNRTIGSLDGEKRQDFQDLMGAGLMMQRPMAGTQVMQGVGLAHKFSDYASDLKVQGVLGRALPGAVPTAVGDFTTATGDRRRAGTQSLDFIDREATAYKSVKSGDHLSSQMPVKKHVAVIAAENALTARNEYQRESSRKELEGLYSKYQKAAKGAKGGIKQEAESIAQLLKDAIDSVEILEDFGGATTPKTIASKDKVRAGIAKFKKINTANALGNQQAEYFDVYDREKYQSQVKDSAAKAMPIVESAKKTLSSKAAPIVDLINQSGPSAATANELEIVGLQTKIQDRAKQIEKLKTRSLAPNADASQAKAASVEIDRHTQAIGGYLEQLGQVEAKIQESKKLLSRPDRLKTKLSNNSDLPTGTADLLISKQAEGKQSRPNYQTPDDPWETEIEKKARIAKERATRKMAQANERREKVSQGMDKAKTIGSKVAGAIFNPDREVSIDMDKVQSAIVTTGKVLHGGGLAIAKTMDAINAGFNALAQTNPGQNLLGASQQAANSLIHVAKTGYGLAKGVENATLTIVPFGKSAKGLIQGVGLPMLAANVAASHIPGGQALLQGAGGAANMLFGPAAHAGISALADGAGGAIGGAMPGFMSGTVGGGITSLIQNSLGGAIGPAIEGAVTLMTGKFMLNSAGVALNKLPGVAQITGQPALPAAQTTFKALPQVKSFSPETTTLALPSSEINQQKSLNDLTDRQLRAYAKTQGMVFGGKAKKDDVVSKLEKLPGLETSTIEAQFDRKGAAIGVDAGLEKGLIARFKEQEKKLHALHAQMKKAQGQQRTIIAEQLLHESTVFSQELSQANRQPMSGKGAKTVGQMLGRVESFHRHAEGTTEAKQNRTATLQASLNGPVYGQTIEAQAQRLYRASDEKQAGLFSRLRDSLARRKKEVVDRNFEAIYAEIAKSNNLKNADSMLPKLELSKSGENSYDPKTNTVSVDRSTYSALSKPLKNLHRQSNVLKPVTHEIQHSQQLLGGTRDEAQAVSDPSFKLNGMTGLNRKQRSLVNQSVDMAIADNPNANAKTIRALEADAYAKENETHSLLLALAKSKKAKAETLLNKLKGSVAKSSESLLIADVKRLQSNLTSIMPAVSMERLQLEQEGDRKGASKIQKGQSRFEEVSTAASKLMEQDSRTPAEVDKLQSYRRSLMGVYETLDRPVPQGFMESLSRMGGGVSEKIKSLKLLGVALLTIPFAGGAIQFLNQFAKDSIQAAIAANRLKTSLEYSTGTKAGANEAYSYADMQSNKLGIDRKSSIEGYAKLRASSKNKISAEQSNALFEGVGAASTTLGLSADDQSGVFLALGQMMSKGTVQAEELRGQIGERLPGAFAIAARSMDVTEAQLGKMMETGSVAADVFLPRFGAQMKKEFGGSAEEASKNLQSSIFRMQGAVGRISEGAGAGAAPAMKLFVDTASAGLGLIEKHGNTLSQVFSVMLAVSIVRLGSLAIATIGPMIASFAAYNGIALTIPGVLGAIGSSLSALLPMVGVFAAKFLLINAGIEIAKTLFGAFVPSDLGNQFSSQAEKINKSLKEIEINGKKAKGSLPGDAPSQGLNISAATFGLSGLVGLNKGDDLVKSVNNNPVLNTLASLTPLIGWAKNTNEANGGKGFATMQEVNYNSDRIALNENQGSAVYKLTGRAYDERGSFMDSLGKAKQEQSFIDAKQAERNRLNTSGVMNKEATAKIDGEIKAAASRRDALGKPFNEYRSQVESSIATLKGQKESIAKSNNYSGEQKKSLLDSVSGQLTNLESVKKQMDQLDKQFGGSGDIITKFNVSLSEMAAKIEEASTAAENAFNKREVSRLEDRKEGRATNEFASSESNVSQSTNERQMAEEKLLATKKAIAEVDKLMRDPTVKADLAKISVNGKSIDGETSAAQLEQAKLGKTDGEKQRIDKMIARRKAIDSVPSLEKNSLESEEKEFQSKQADALEKMERKKKSKEVQFKEFEGKANIGLINAQKGNKINETDVAIRRSEIDGISAKEGQSAVKNEIAEIDKLYNEGMISKEEHTKRSIELRGRLVDANVKAAQAELAIEKAKNAKILQDWEMSLKKRELAAKTVKIEQTIDLIKGQSGNRMSGEDVAIKKSEIDQSSAKKSLENIEKQKEELDALRAKGVMTADEYQKRMLDIQSNLLDAKQRVAEAELAIEQAKNAKIVYEFDRLSKYKSFALDSVQGETSNQIKRDALSGKIFGVGGEAENRNQQITTSRQKIDLLKNDRKGIDELRENGTISQKDYETRSQDSVNQIRQEQEKLLNLEIQKRLALYQTESDAFKRSNNEIIRGLESQRNSHQMISGVMSAKQSLLESQVNFAKAQQGLSELQIGLQGEGLTDSRGNIVQGTQTDGGMKQSSMQIDALRIQNLANIQSMEMKILEIKETQSRSSMKQLEIESKIALSKQKIALNESEKRLKDAKLTGDVNAIANAQQDVTGQSQILGFENEKLKMIGEQNKLAEERLGIERKTAETGMATETLKTRADAARNRRNGYGGGGGGGASGGASGGGGGMGGLGGGGGLSFGLSNEAIQLQSGEGDDYDRYKEKFRKKNGIFSEKEQALDVFNSLQGLSGRQREIATVAARQSGFGDVAKSVDLADRIEKNGGGKALDREMRKLNFSSGMGTGDVVKAIQKLGDRLESSYQGSGDNYISGDYSGILNQQTNSRNNRL